MPSQSPSQMPIMHAFSPEIVSNDLWKTVAIFGIIGVNLKVQANQLAWTFQLGKRAKEMATKTSTSNSATSTKGTKAMTTTTSTKPAKKPVATATKTKKPAVKLAEREPDLGDYQTGDKVATKDGRTWTVEGPAQGGTTLKLTRKLDGGKTESVFRFARNLSAAK